MTALSTLVLPTIKGHSAESRAHALAYRKARYTVDLDHTRVRYLAEKTPWFPRYLICCFFFFLVDCPSFFIIKWDFVHILRLQLHHKWIFPLLGDVELEQAYP